MSIGYVKQSAASVPTPPSGEQNTFVDSADDKFKKKLSDGSVVNLETAAAGVTSFEGRTGSVVATSGDYTASEITNVPAGDIIATNVQAAIDELDSEKAPIAHVGSGGVSEHPLVDGSTAGFMSPSDFTKLAGIASGATANDTDSNLKNRANHTGTQTSATISDFSSAARTATVQDAISDGITNIAPSQNAVFDALALKEDLANKGTANGYASLDSGGKIPTSQIPQAIQDKLTFAGTWNANTNTPTLASGTGTKGNFYIVTVAGTTNLDGENDWNPKDWALFDGTVWRKVDSSEQVTSVNGFQGAVVLDTDDISEGSNLYHTTSRARTAAVLNTLGGSETDQAPSVASVNNALGTKANKAGDTFTGPVVIKGDNAGTGYQNFEAQTSAPPTPSSGFRLFANALGKLAWKGTNGFLRIFDGSSNTADRTYTLPDVSGTLMMDPMTAAGAMIRRNALNQTVELPIGAEDEILRVVSGLPEWVEENLSQDIGGGGDGNLTLSGSFTAPDILYYNELTIDAGTVFNPDAYIIYAKKLNLTNAPAGAIVRNGNPGTNSANNTGGAGGAAFTARVLATNAAGGTGAAGQSNAGAQGGAGGAVSVGNGGNGGASGASGAGGTGASANAIAGGAVTTNTHLGRFEYQFIRGVTQISGGAGGRGGNSGGGDGANTSRGGGGGGAGGAVLVLICGEIVTGPSTPAGVIQAKGGLGGSQTSAPASGNVGGAGGGGGGGGGYIYIAYVKKTGAPVADLIDASGGNGGNGSNGLGTGIGGNGGQGGNGGRIQLFNITEGMGTLTVGSSGSNGTAGSGVTGGVGGNGGSCKVAL